MQIDKFEWDEVKAITNLQKHGIRFDECLSVFQDVDASIIPDVKHSQIEEREIIIGQVLTIGIILVVFTKRGSNIRVISARKASKNERKFYEQRRTQP
jgi:uncharacterized DUF497 family protein